MSARTIRTCDACGIDIDENHRFYMSRTFYTSYARDSDTPMRDPQPEKWEACSERCARQMLRQQAASLDEPTKPEPTNMPPLSRPYR